MKKRVFSALLALCLAFSLFGTALAATAAETTAAPVSASSAEGQTDLAVTDDTSGETAAPEETETPAETPEETETQAVTETPGETETSDGAEQPTDAAAVSMPAQSFEQTLDNGITVAVEAPEGALPQGVTLNAAMLDTDSEDARQAAAQLDEAGVSYDGFVALDVSFTDASGAEVEPALPVTVRFELPEGLLPEDVDTASLTVQHLAEDDTGAVVSVETVADAAEEAEGTISVNDTEASAAFVVEGFSTFTLTWVEDNTFWDDTESLEFRIVDTDGNELTLPDNYDLSYALPESGKVTFETIVEKNGIKTITVGGVEYVFQNATLVSDQLRHPINAAERIDGIVNDEVRLYDSVMPNSTGFYTRDDGGKSNEHLELVYRRADESNSEVYEPEPEYSKTANTDDGGQTYDLTLSVSGDVGSSTEKQKVDVLFIVDQSGSMDEHDMGQGKTRQQVVAEQAEALAEALAANENLDAQFAVVTFSDSLGSTQYYNDAAIRLSWTDDTSAVYSAANQESTGGTNYEAGMMTGRAALIESRPDALKYVIFLSDGEPTYCYDKNGNTYGNGSDFRDTYLTSAIKQAEFYSAVNGFFTIRVGNESNADARLTELYAAVRDAVGASGDSENFGNYRAKDSGELAQKFAEIAAQITSLSMSNVSICDTLSEWVEPVSDAEPYVIVRDAEGNKTSTENSSFKVTYDPENKELRLEFDEEYELKDGYVYELHLQIQPSDKAYSAGSGSYTKIGDPDTGTYAGESGFPSNATAILTYDTDLTQDHSLTYDMPVVQVRTATLTLQKTFVGLTDEDVYYILFGQAERPNDSAGNEAWNSYYQANFSFDVNFCDSTLSDKQGNGQDYMAEDSSISDAIMKPGDSTSKVTNGGDFIVYAAKCLNDPGSAASLTSATNEANRATLEKVDGNWVYTQVIDVAICTSNNLFYTVFEQHGELPGYAKLDPDSAVYSVNLNGTNSWTGHGKFVQDADVKSPAINLPDEDEINGIRYNVLAHLSITDDTTISFTNYYTDAMTLTKTVTLDGETATEALLDEIGTTEYAITLRPADTTKLVNSHDLGPGWSTKMNGYEVGVSYSNSLTGQTHDNKTLTFHEDGTLTVKLYAGESVTINDLPAINWSVVETTPSDTTDYYWTGVTYAEDYNDAKVDNGPRDDQYDADSGNNWADNEKAAEKDNKGADHWNRYESDDTYGMTDSTDGTVVLDVDVTLTEPNNGPSVAVTLTNDYAHYYTLIIEKQVTGGMGDTSEFFDFFTSVSRGEDVVAVNSGSATNNNLGLGFVLTTQGTNARYNSDPDTVDDYGFQLADNDTLTISKLKEDDVVYLREDDYSDEGYTTTYTGVAVNGDGTQITDEYGNYIVNVSGENTELKVTVTNHRDPATPTDADANSTAPFVVLTACAAFAGLALAGSIVAVRLRRRRQE